MKKSREGEKGDWPAHSMQDEFTIISDLAKGEDELVVRMYLSYFRLVLESFLLACSRRAAST